MNKKNIITILIILIIVVIAILTAYVYFSDSSIQYKNVFISSSCELDIPVSSNLSNSTIADNITILNDTQHDVLVISDNSYDDENLSSTLINGVSFASIRDSYKNGGEQEKISNQTVFYNKNTKYYIAVIGNNNTHDNILIITKDKKILTHMINSITYLNVNTNNNSTGNSTVNDDSSGNSESDDNGPHVVSKKRCYNAQAGHGYFDEVRYSDGNFRQYDSESGKLIGSSYDSDQGANGGSLPEKI
ncbi:MAG: hypothetical protein ACI4VU_00015 [Methanobrevibacter sp.]